MKWYLTLLSLVVIGVGCSNMNKSCCDGDKHKDKEEGDEVKLTLEQVPPAVRATLVQEAGGSPINSVDREEKDGKTVYEADVTTGGKNWEIKVADDGKLLGKKIDDESGEKKGKDKDDEKEEHGEHK